MVRVIAGAALLAGCGRLGFVPEFGVSDSAGGDAADAAPDVLVAAGTDCASIASVTPGSPDGVYAIDPDGDAGPRAPFTVWCADMGTTPVAYLDLPAQGATSNFSRYAGGGGCACPDSILHFQRVRVDPQTLVVATEDRRFTTLDSDATCIEMNLFNCIHGRKLNWGMAGDCRGGATANGTGNLDLTGTPFHVAPSAVYQAAGSSARGTVAFDGPRKSASTTGGGNCGWYGPQLLGPADNYSVGVPAPLPLAAD